MKQIVFEIIKKALKKRGISLDDEKIISLIEIPKDYSKGDFAFPCFILENQLEMPPNEIAIEIRESIRKLPEEFEDVYTDGAYINFFLDRKKLAFNLINEIKKKGDSFGKIDIGKNQKTMVEFSQPNTHKAFHVGHIRGTSIGESLSRILEFSGYKVIRANYSGDIGMHIAKWIWDYMKYHLKEKKKLKDDESWIASIYVDAIKRLKRFPSLQEEVNEVNRKLETKEDEKINALWKKTREFSIKSWEKIYSELNTHFDVHFFESEMEKKGKKISEELVKKNIAIIDDGATIIKFKDKNLGVWVLLRGDGTVLYSAKDLALAEIKFKKYKLDKSIYVIGTEQAHHIKQLFETLKLMNFDWAKLCKYIPFEEVRLPTGKMSSRTGENILYSEFMKKLVDYSQKEIKKREGKISEKELKKRAIILSVAAIKYSMLKQDHKKKIIFSVEESLNFEGDTGPYILYAYARANSILKKSKKIPKLETPSELDEKETKIILKINEFKKEIYGASNQMNPSLIANYSYQLAQMFNEFYHSSQVIGADNETFRLNLVEAFRITLKNSLNLLGINTLEKM